MVKSTTSWSRSETAIVHGQMNLLAFDTSTTRAVIGLGLRSGQSLRETDARLPQARPRPDTLDRGVLAMGPSASARSKRSVSALDPAPTPAFESA